MDSLKKTIELVERAGDGDEAAFDRLHRAIRLLLDERHGSRLDTDDVLATACRRLLPELGRIEWRDEFTLLEHLTEMAARAIHAELADPSNPAPIAPDTGAAPDVGSERILEQSMRVLPEQHRAVIYLRDFLGASWPETRRELALPDEASARALHRAALVRISRPLRERGAHVDRP